MGESKKGYFKFSVKEDGLYITVYPPKEDGQRASIEDMLKYIDKKKIIDCDIVVAKEAFAMSYEPKTVKVSDIKPFSNNEFGEYNISSDCMSVYAVFYPPFEGASELSEAEIIKDLESIGVKYGVDQEAIQGFLKEREYGKTYILAKGVVPREGSDGEIIYNFNVDLKPRPKIKEDGTVDFHTLENLNHIKPGDVIATMIPEDKGDPGMDVLARPVMPRKVRRVAFKFGKNLKISEDGHSLITQVSGHVILEADKIFVSNVLELVDVDNSTGDIDYDGDITVKGNVLAGFSVIASGDISVNGVVEGATIIAGGNIILNRGIQGMNKAVLKADGNIVSKFIESANLVTAGGSIDTDTILHSKVIAKGPINANGKNGLIVGGDVKSLILITAKTIGNEMGTSTIVGVGVDASIKKRVDELKRELDVLGNNKIQLTQLVTALRKKQETQGFLEPEKQEMQQKTMRNMILLEQQLLSAKKELEECRMQLTEDINARIRVSRSIYVGTKLMFGEQYLFIKEKYDYCQFMKSGADIKCVSL